MSGNKAGLLVPFEDRAALDAYEKEIETIGPILEPFESQEIELPELADVNTSWSPLVKIPRTGVTASRDNPPCSSNEANCEFVTVQLPLGAQVHEVSYYMNRTGTNSSSVRPTRPGSHSWAKVYPAVQYNADGFTWVRAKYKNWRTSYDRWGRIAVTWTLPNANP